MKKVKLDETKSYEAPGHFGYSSFRIFSKDNGGAENFSVALSHFLPAGGAEMASGSTEKVYFVIAGSITVQTEDGQELTLNPMDSLYIPAGEKRSVLNKTKAPATMLVVVSYPK